MFWNLAFQVDPFHVDVFIKVFESLECFATELVAAEMELIVLKEDLAMKMFYKLIDYRVFETTPRRYISWAQESNCGLQLVFIFSTIFLWIFVLGIGI